MSTKAGSAAQIVFSTPADLAETRAAVQALNRSYITGKWVWLDAKKENYELRPARLVHRVCDMLLDFESQREDPLEVEKVMNGKFVKVGGHRAGFTLHSQWKWTGYAVKRYSAEQLEMAKGYADEE